MLLQVACETFCLDDDDTLLEVALSLGSEALSATTVRFVEADPQPIAKGVLTVLCKPLQFYAIVEATRNLALFLQFSLVIIDNFVTTVILRNEYSFFTFDVNNPNV